MSHSGGAVCNNCRPKIGELYQKQVGAGLWSIAFISAHLRNRCRWRLTFRFAFRDYGHNVNDARVRYIRFVFFILVEWVTTLTSDVRMFSVQAEIAQSSIWERSHRKMSKMLMPCLIGLITMRGKKLLGSANRSTPSGSSCYYSLFLKVAPRYPHIVLEFAQSHSLYPIDC